MDPLAPWRAASMLIESYGERALDEAGRYLLGMRAIGDQRGAALWLAVVGAVTELQSLVPGEGRMLH